MSAEENKVLMQRFFNEVVNQRAWTVLDQIVGPTFQIDPDDATGHWPPGPEGMKRFLMWLRTVFPDIHYTVDDVIAEADKVVARVHAQGTQQGEYVGTPGTGKPVTYSEVLILRIAEGKIVEWWVHIDRLSVLEQIGAFSIA